MIGFENYSPQSWLTEKVLSIHVSVAPTKTVAKNPFRKGRWSANTVGGALFAVAIASSSILIGQPTSIIGGMPRAAYNDSMQGVTFADAPPEYYEKLTVLVNGTPRLPAQSLAFDPPALV